MKHVNFKNYTTHFVQAGCVALGVMLFHLTGCQSGSQLDAEVPSHPIEQGVSAPFAGFIGDELIVGGGCNFPDVPAADGGKKVFYADVVAWNAGSKSSEWKSLRGLPSPNAYGATVEVKEGLVLIGGVNQDASLNNVFLLIKDEASDVVQLKELPSLPEAIDNATATCIGRALYVTGGNQGNGGNALYTMNLDTDTDTEWTKLTDYPGAKRIQPVLLADSEKLYLFGGFDVRSLQEQSDSKKGDSKKGDSKKKDSKYVDSKNEVKPTKVGIISSDYIVYDVANNEWSRPYPLPSMSDGSPRALVGAAGTRVNDWLFLAGGVNYGIFKDAVEGNAPADYMKRPTEWYQFSKEVLAYNLRTKDWKIIPDVDGFNKAGGILLHHDGLLYMVCGEIKPGIRTNEIKTVTLKGLLSPQTAN